MRKRTWAAGKQPNQGGRLVFTKKDIDYIFENIIGGGGIWQWLVILLIWPIGIASEFPLLLHLFTAYEHKHRCYIPGCDDENGVDITQCSRK